jgi:diphthamide synthase subunit DPH2
MKSTSLGKPSIGIILLAVFTLILNLICGLFIIPLYNLWRPTQPNFRSLAYNPYQHGVSKNTACFSSLASDAYFSRVKESGVCRSFEIIVATDETPNHRNVVKMLVKRGDVDFVETAVIVNGCIESFQSDPR